ncbi:MAG: phosphatase PAP2 family protein [Candidatus Woesearchaeota archaeon]
MAEFKKCLPAIIITTILLLIAAQLNSLSAKRIDVMPQLTVSRDLIHELVSFNIIYSIITELIILAMTAVFVGYIIKRKKYDVLPLVIGSLAVFYLIRALLLQTTILKSPFPQGYHFGILYYFIPGGGAFPSGHTGYVFLLFFFTSNTETFLKRALLISAILVAIFMIISYGHYTIDVIGGFLLAFAIHSAVTIYRRKRMTPGIV